MEIITRTNAISNLKKYIGKDLSDYAKEFNITIAINGHQNKGWKGQTLERLAGLKNSTEKAPNGLSWELKSVCFTEYKGEIKPKETMAITMINPSELKEHDFFNSHCWSKLKSLIVCAVKWNGHGAENSELLAVTSLDFLKSDELIKEIKEDYEFIRNKLITQGFESLTGKDGKWIQARTKGTGGINPNTGERRPITRAFYARRTLVEKIFELSS